jgi:hypothetical protein
MGRVRKIVRELNRLENVSERRIDYLKEVEETDEDRAITELVHDDTETVESINGILKGKNGEELKGEIKYMINYYRQLQCVVRNLHEFIKETA